MNDDDVVGMAGWVPSHSVAMLFLATARAGTRSAPPELMSQLVGPHVQVPGLRAEVVLRGATEELQAAWKAGGLRQVGASLQKHCRLLASSLDDAQRRRVISEMLQVVDAVTDDAAGRGRVRAFPYAAARVWQLDALAAEIQGA